MDWSACIAAAPRLKLRRRAWRLIESQEQVATHALVDTLDEQALLEELIETVKPARVPGSEKLHYLLATPFRYPPLPWGSRYGRPHEPSLFYASAEPETVFAESAFYRFVFWYGMETPPPSARLSSQHTLFSVRVASNAALRLQDAPFARYESLLRHPSLYAETQALGSLLREAGIEVFEYLSARVAVPAVNVALFVPQALAAKAPDAQQAWLCETRAGRVLFSGEGRTQAFVLEDFLVDGRLPQPA